VISFHLLKVGCDVCIVLSKFLSVGGNTRKVVDEFSEIFESVGLMTRDSESPV